MNAESDFLIADPVWLWLIWAIPILCVMAWMGARLGRQALLKHFSDERADRLMAGVSPARRWTKSALLCASLFFSIFALADPKWGVAEQTVLTSSRDILVLLDVSKSMLATDVAPSRLERVKLDIQDMLLALKGDRVGLIVFAGTPVLKCPLTTDYGFFRKALARAGPQSVSRGGTLIGDAVREGLNAFTDQVPHNKIMILISDGEDQGSYPLEAARLAAERGVRIYTVGIGDRDIGSRILVDGEYIKDAGQVVWTKLNSEELRTIAAETGGAYIPAGTRSVDLDRIYRQKIAGLDRAEQSETKKKFLESRYQVFLIIALALLLAECCVPERARLQRSVTA